MVFVVAAIILLFRGVLLVCSTAAFLLCVGAATILWGIFMATYGRANKRNALQLLLAVMNIYLETESRNQQYNCQYKSTYFFLNIHLV